MSDEKQNQLKEKIAAVVSALASTAKITGKSEADYQLESLYVDRLKKSLRSGKEVSLVELAQRLGYERDKHAFLAEVDKHGFRMSFFWWLFGLTCAWLLIVVCLVVWTALSPSVGDREKLIQLQTGLGVLNGTATNVLQPAAIRAADPWCCPILFHLSDSVLVAFITSTTVAVLGLFLTAARWLYGSTSEKSSPISNGRIKDEQSD